MDPNIHLAQLVPDPGQTTGVLYQYGAIGVFCFLLICSVAWLVKELKEQIKLYNAAQRERAVEYNALQEKRIEEQKQNILALHDNTAALNNLTKVMQTALDMMKPGNT